MELHIYQLILITAVTLGASYIQSVTGFGFGIFSMMFLPYLLLYTESNILSSILSAFTSISLAVMMFRKITWKNIIFPIIGCLFATYGAVTFIKTQENRVMTLILGIALLVLSVYFFFFSSKIRIKPTWYAGLIAGVISGVMGGMFAIGGPPVVIYFMQSEESSERYLATISAYFVLSNVISITIKAASGFVTLNVWAGLAAGVVGMLIGSLAGKLTRKKMNSAMLKKVVYGFMAVSGAINIVTSLMQ